MVHGLSLREARDLVDLRFEELARASKSEESVRLSGSGSFSLRESPERVGRNSNTWDAAIAMASKRLRFKPLPLLTERVNDSS